jgi:hypothetical protein
MNRPRGDDEKSPADRPFKSDRSGHEKSPADHPFKSDRQGHKSYLSII